MTEDTAQKPSADFNIARLGETLVGVAQDIQRAQERFAGFAEGVGRTQQQLADWAEGLSNAQRQFAEWADGWSRVQEHLAKFFGSWAERMEGVLAPFQEEHRIATVILRLGLVPHLELFALLAEVQITPEKELGKMSQQIACECWPRLQPRLELSVDECFGDQKLYNLYNELVRAHDVGLYHLTTSASAAVIERAARLAQQHETQAKSPEKWLKSDLGELPSTAVPGWRALSILTEQTFMHCWSDAEADAIRYPNRHAAAHGHGSKISTVVDSLNAVLVGHFVVVAAISFSNMNRVNDE